MKCGFDSPIGIEDKGNVLHRSIRQPLLEVDAEFFEARTGFFNVLNCNGDMSEPASGIGISVGVTLEAGVGFRSVVVRQFQNAFNE